MKKDLGSRTYNLTASLASSASAKARRLGGGHGGAPQPAPADGIGEEGGVIRRVQPVVCDVPDDGGRLLPVDEPGGLEEEILRIQAEHGKCLRGYALENGCRSGTGQAGFLHQPAH